MASQTNLEVSERNIHQSTDPKRHFKSNIARRLRQWAHKPNLVHRRDDKRDRAYPSAQGCEASGQLFGVVPGLFVVLPRVVPPEPEVLDEDDRYEGRCPVADEPEEVEKGIVESVCTDNRERDNSVIARLVTQKWTRRFTHIAVATIENT